MVQGQDVAPPSVLEVVNAGLCVQLAMNALVCMCKRMQSITYSLDGVPAL